VKPITTRPASATAQTQQRTQTTQTTPTTQIPSTQQTQQAPADGDVFHGSRDMRTRVGVTTLTAGPTVTALPKLLDDWKVSLLDAAAEDLADAEIIAPVLDKALKQAESDKGESLTRQERRGISNGVYKQLEAEFETAKKAHHKDLTKSPAAKKRTERDVLLEQRPRVDKLKDVFSPVAQQLPGARDNEIVLWENKNLMVLVDTFAPSPKALVVPKEPVALPVDAKPVLLDELAVVAAHTSDAFSRALGTPPAGIWVNPPQHLTVKQMHVHVLPDAGPFTNDGHPAKAFLEDPQFKPQIEAFFATIAKELAAKLGPAT